MTADTITAIKKALEELRQPKSMSMYTTQNDMISDLMKDRRLAVEALESLQRKNEALKEENGSLLDENSDLRNEPWPEWAKAVLKVIRSHTGYDGYDDAIEGVDMPLELEEHLSELRKKDDDREKELVAMLNSADESRVGQIRRAEAAEAEVKRLREAETLETYYERQIEWSRETFGHALRTNGIIDHIKKELREIEADPHDLSEWVDVVILAMDGFWRHGGSAGDLFNALIAKQQKNMARTWPDWRTMSEDSAIEHDRSKDALASTGGEHHADK